MSDRTKPTAGRCANCGKRIFLEHHGKYALAVWHHYGYARRECDGQIAKHATPVQQNSQEK
jgi:hypothetical protein